MSNMFKTVRIVHSPMERYYEVQQKHWWHLRWGEPERFHYVDVRSTSPHGNHWLASDAYAKAKERAETLLAKTVVWQQSNWTWG